MGNSAVKSVFGLRQKLADRLATIVNWQIDHSERLGELDRRLGEVQRLTDHHRDVLADADEVFRLQRWSANELERVIPQVAAQEAQLQTLRESLTAVPTATAPEVEAARSLIDEIRREHAQIRTRLTGIAQYEDRLRKLEDRAAVEH